VRTIAVGHGYTERTRGKTENDSASLVTTATYGRRFDVTCACSASLARFGSHGVRGGSGRLRAQSLTRGTTPVGRRVIDGRGDMKGENVQTFFPKNTILRPFRARPSIGTRENPSSRRTYPHDKRLLYYLSRGRTPLPHHYITDGGPARSGPQIL